VGEISALTWALEIADPHRFSFNADAMSYCGLTTALTNRFCVFWNISIAARLMRSRSLTDSGTSSKVLIRWAKYFFPCNLSLLEATLFSAWIYDTLKPYAQQLLDMAHPARMSPCFDCCHMGIRKAFT
jgi:hypothetical protein